MTLIGSFEVSVVMDAHAVQFEGAYQGRPRLRHLLRTPQFQYTTEKIYQDATALADVRRASQQNPTNGHGSRRGLSRVAHWNSQYVRPASLTAVIVLDGTPKTPRGYWETLLEMRYWKCQSCLRERSSPDPSRSRPRGRGGGAGGRAHPSSNGHRMPISRLSQAFNNFHAFINLPCFLTTPMLY